MTGKRRGPVSVAVAQASAGEGEGTAVEQLALPFADGDDSVTAPEASRRDRRPPRAARLVRIDEPALRRSLEEERLETQLIAFMPPGKGLALRLHDNRHTMISVRRRPEGYTVRAHRMFANVESRLVRAMARYVVHNDPRASRLLGEHIEVNQHIIKQQPRRPRKVVLRTKGRHHDLQAIFDQLNRDRFDGKLDATITWGPSLRLRRPQKSIKMGSYSVEDRIIRIHPLLDRADVPGYFVAWIVFHEMLHGKHAAERKGARRCYHTRDFVAEERSFDDYERAHAWERAHIDRLLAG